MKLKSMKTVYDSKLLLSGVVHMENVIRKLSGAMVKFTLKSSIQVGVNGTALLSTKNI